MPEISSGIASVNGTKLYYEIAGVGFPVVLIHSGISDHRMWDAQFAVFAEHYRVLRYDLRWFGKSGVATDRYSNVADLYELLKYLQIERTHIVGISAGGNVAVSFALEHPDMVAGLVLVSSGLNGFQGWTEATALRAQEIETVALSGEVIPATELAIRLWMDGPTRGPDKVDPTARERAKRILLENSHTLTMTEEYEIKLDPRPITRLGEIKSSTLILVGEYDIPEVWDISQILLENIPTAQRIVFPDAAHLLPLEKPREFNQTVLQFFSNFDTTQLT